MLTSSLRPIGVLMGCCLMALAGQAQAQNTPPGGYTLCAAEGQRCGFSGAANVVYGARDSWTSPRGFTDGVACTNANFGDPLYGVVKACYVSAASAPAPAPAPTVNLPPAGYSLCAAENQHCSFTGAANVVYGARTTWTQPRSFSGGTACNNATFGDPLAGVVKACYTMAVAAPAPAPTPTPVPPPASLSLRLAWIAPQVNADGSPLTDLAGYRVKVGTQSGTYTRIVSVDGPHTLSATISGLPAATYYVVVTAIDASNNESAPSIEMVKVLK
jgi:hypothetical protein